MSGGCPETVVNVCSATSRLCLPLMNVATASRACTLNRSRVRPPPDACNALMGPVTYVQQCPRPLVTSRTPLYFFGIQFA